MKEKTKELGNSNVLFDFYGKRPEMSQLVPLSLQHVLAAIVGVITPSMIIAGVCGLTDAEKTMMIQAALIFTALATFLQLFPLFHKIGAALPVIMGTSFAYVPTLTAIGGEFGIGAIMGAQIIGGIVAIVFAIFVKQIRKLFPDIVTGTVIFTIGLSLYPTAIRYMAGGSGHPEFGGLKNWFIALLTFAVVLFLNNFTKGVLKLGSLFFGIIVGYVVSLFMGMVDFTNVMNTTSIIAFPQLMHFKIEFAPAACASLAIVYAVNAVQTIGDLTSTTVGGMDRVPTDNELQGGILVQGVASIVGAFFGALLQPERRYRNHEQSSKPRDFRGIRSSASDRRPDSWSVRSTYNHPSVCHRRRNSFRIRADRNDRCTPVHKGWHDSKKDNRSWYVCSTWCWYHPGIRMLTGTWNPGVDQYRIWKFVRGSGNDHGDHPEPHPSAGRVRTAG